MPTKDYEENSESHLDEFDGELTFVAFYTWVMDGINAAARQNHTEVLLSIRPIEHQFIDPIGAYLRGYGYTFQFTRSYGTLAISWKDNPE